LKPEKTDVSPKDLSVLLNEVTDSDLFNITYYDGVHVNSSSKMSLEQFGKKSYAWGYDNSPVMPHFYSAYQIYEANQQTQQWKFYNWVNMTN